MAAAAVAKWSAWISSDLAPEDPHLSGLVVIVSQFDKFELDQGSQIARRDGKNAARLALISRSVQRRRIAVSRFSPPAQIAVVLPRSLGS
jgi:hypothetical protein